MAVDVARATRSVRPGRSQGPPTARQLLARQAECGQLVIEEPDGDGDNGNGGNGDGDNGNGNGDGDNGNGNGNGDGDNGNGNGDEPGFQDPFGLGFSPQVYAAGGLAFVALIALVSG